MKEQTIKTIMESLLKGKQHRLFDIFDENITQNNEIEIAVTNNTDMQLFKINKTINHISISDLRQVANQIA